jgi:hypothetical protein
MRLPQSQGARVALLGTVATLAAFFLFRSGGETTRRTPEAAVPKDSFLVASIDVEELRRSPVYEVVLGKGGLGGTKALGLGSLETACGFDPFTRIEKLAVAVPEKEGEHELGVIARVSLTREELARCKERLDVDRDGAIAPAKEHGSFLVVDGIRAGSVRGRLAYGAGQMLVVSTGEWFERILAVADGHAPALREAAEHVALRGSLTSREGWRAPTALVTAVLPRALRDRIRGEMADEGRGRDGANEIMAGVLGVRALGLAVRAGRPGGRLEARMELLCDDPSACAAVDKLIQKKRFDWSKDLGVRMIGLGAVVDALETKQEGVRLSVATEASADALAAAVGRVLALKGPARPGGPPAAPSDR